MTAMQRHPLPQSLEGNEKRMAALSKNIARFHRNLGEAPGLTLPLAQHALQVTQCQLLVDPNAERFDTYSSLLCVARSGTALFKSANNTEEFDCIIRSRVSMGVTGPTHQHSPTAWLNTLWAATICRDRDLVEDLCRTPDETLRAAGEYDEYVYSWIDALKTFFANGEDLYRKINRSIELTDPEQLVHSCSVPDIALLRYFPAMKLLFSLVSGDSIEFNDDLRESVELHQRFWTTNEERLRSPDGFFALSATALAAIAHDRGITIDIESDYIPLRFVTDFWVHASS